MKQFVLILVLVLLFTTMPVAAKEAAPETVIAVETVEAEWTQTVSVPVTITGNPGFAALVLRLTYDEEVLRLEGVQKSAYLEKSGFWAANAEHEGMVDICWYDQEEMTKDGELFFLTFTVLQEAALGELPITVALRNDDPADFIGEDGCAIPVSFQTGGVCVTEYRWHVTAQSVWMSADRKKQTVELAVIHRNPDMQGRAMIIAAAYDDFGKLVALSMVETAVPSDHTVQISLDAAKPIASGKVFLVELDRFTALCSCVLIDMQNVG